MKISKNSVVELNHEHFDEQGQVIVHDSELLNCLHDDYHGAFPKTEAALKGKSVGGRNQPYPRPGRPFQ